MTPLSLFELNNLVRSVLESTLQPSYWVKAELAEARVASNGHFYCEFVQKNPDTNTFLARARGVMWSRTYNILAPLFERATGEHLRAGLNILVEVEPEFHEAYGYSLKVVDIDPSFTMGDMARRRKEILDRLAADGILEDNKTLPLPLLMKNIAVISSASAAGYGDFCNQLSSNPYGLHFNIQLFPASMQGENVPQSIMHALEKIANQCYADGQAWHCVVIIRGGGATSDLADYEDFNLAAAVAQMPVPVIVGIGHERDETVLDFVANTRVKTPTAAAAFIIEHGAQELAELQALADSLRSAASQLITQQHNELESIAKLLPHIHALLHEQQTRQLEALAVHVASATQRCLWTSAQDLEKIRTAISQALTTKIQKEKFWLQSMAQSIDSFNPEVLLKRGYTLTCLPDGQLVRSVADLHSGDRITTIFADGTATGIVEEVTESREFLSS
ncbi:MAG: exodeoxyribonuclease VII large subunit [Bacteroidaceae bacterium]|nr:exodeoxyribonuclease VII large subunit [Bacteroidaceae bacterium]